jgi:hypothetical protein
MVHAEHRPALIFGFTPPIHLAFCSDRRIEPPEFPQANCSGTSCIRSSGQQSEFPAKIHLPFIQFIYLLLGLENAVPRAARQNREFGAFPWPIWLPKLKFVRPPLRC